MKKEKKVINILTVLFIFHKNNVKTFLNWILNQYRATLVNMTLFYNLEMWKIIFGLHQHSYKLPNTHTGHTQYTPTQINIFFNASFYFINYYIN